MQPLPYIRHLTAANPGYMTLDGTNQYLLGREQITVIDVALGSSENLDAILEQVEAMGGKRVEKILLTHIHRDHSGGALALRKRCGAKLGISRLRAGFLGEEDFTYVNGDRIPYDSGELEVIHTPGHESGHCCFYEFRQEILFTGDHILGRGTTVIPPPDGDMAQYIRSLKRLLDLKIRLLLPGHGPAVADPYAKIKEYIEHRMMREREVIQSLREGDRTIPAIATKIYAELPVPLTNVARLSVEAHLLKLIEEGRVRKEGECYLLNEGE